MDILIYCWMLAVLISTIWMICAKPRKEITSQYPKSIFFQVQFPLSQKWTHAVKEQHVEGFKKYQQRSKIWYFCLIVPPVFWFIFELVKSVLLLQEFSG